MKEKTRILIFGAGVIGCTHAIKFSEAGFDVTIFARSKRFLTLKEQGLRYYEKNKIKSLEVKVIDTLEEDDCYDFVFLTVRYEQADAALAALKHNNSKTIVTMLNNSKGFSHWQQLIGDKLLPAFPGVGGQIKNGILAARFPPKALAKANFGEVDGSDTMRVKNLAQVFEKAQLPYKVNNNMEDFLITHSVSDIAMVGALYLNNEAITEKSLKSRRTAHGITITLKRNLEAIQKAGVNLEPSFYNVLLKCPNFLLDAFFMIWLRTNLVKDMLAPQFAANANQEMLKLTEDLRYFLKGN